MSVIDLSDFRDDGRDPTEELINRTSGRTIEDRVSNLSMDGEIDEFFKYSLDIDSNKLTIQLTSLGVSRFGKIILPIDHHSDINEMIVSEEVPSIQMNFDKYGVTKLAQLFNLPVYNAGDLKDLLHIHHADTKREYTDSPSEIIDTIKRLSGFKTGQDSDIELNHQKSMPILRENVFDSQKDQGSSPLGRTGKLYRYHNNQLVPVEQRIGGPEVAYQYAAQLAMQNNGIGVGSSKIFRMSESSSSDFIRVQDIPGRMPLPASVSGEYSFNAIEKTNELKKQSIGYKHYTGLDSPDISIVLDDDKSLSRLMFDNMSGSLNKDILTSAIFNKLIGAKNINGNSVNFLTDVIDNNRTNKREVVQEIDMKNSFMPEFDTGNLDSSGKAPADLTIDDIARSSDNFHQLSKLEPEAFTDCFEKALKIRKDMEKIISYDLIKQEILTVEEVYQFNEYMNHDKGLFKGFEKTREQESENLNNLVEFPLPDNNESKKDWQAELRSKNKGVNQEDNNDNASSGYS